MTSQVPLQVFTDSDGSIAVGFIGEGVLYTRIVAGLSASLGALYATHIQSLLNQSSTVRYFADISRMKQYDLLARSAFVRVVLANRRKLSSLAVHARTDGHGLASRTFTASLGSWVALVSEAHEFETQLVRAAPLAKERIDPRTYTPPGGTLRPIK